MNITISPGAFRRMEAAGFEPGTENPLGWLLARLDDLTLEKQNREKVHGIFDRAGVPPAAHVACDDPECETHLQHRAHVLTSEVARLRADLARLRDLIMVADTIINALLCGEHAGMTMTPDLTHRIDEWIDATRQPILDALDAADRAAGRTT